MSRTYLGLLGDEQFQRLLFPKIRFEFGCVQPWHTGGADGALKEETRFSKVAAHHMSYNTDICIHIYIYICRYTFTYIYTHMCTDVYIHMWIS